MDETKRVVVEHFPAEKLSQELRGDIAPGSKVTITVTQERAAPRRRPLSDFIGAGKGLYRSLEHVLEVLREGRDAETFA